MLSGIQGKRKASIISSPEELEDNDNDNFGLVEEQLDRRQDKAEKGKQKKRKCIGDKYSRPQEGVR